MKFCSCLIAVLGLTALGAAQEGTRPDFSGTWSIDRSLSNDPAQARFDGNPASPNQGSTPRRGGGFGGGLGGFGRGGGSYGGSGGSGGSRNRANDDGTTSDEKTRLAALTDELKKASATLVISHHEPSFVATDAQDHAFFCHTTGEREDQRIGEMTMSSTTHWDGDRVVTELDVSSRRKLIYTYTLLAATKQLVLRVRLDITSGARAGGQELKLVYRLAPPTASK